MAEYEHEEYNATRAVAETIQTDAFKKHLFDPEDVSLADISTVLLDSGLVDDLEGYQMEFVLGWPYLIIFGQPPRELGIDRLTDRLDEFENRLGMMEGGSP